MSEASLEKGVDKPGGRISSIPIEHRGSHSQMLSPDTLTDGQIEEDFLAAFTPPQIDQSPESSISKKDKEKLIIPFNSTRINPDVRENQDNPVHVFDKPIILHGSSYGYGAGSADRTEISPGTPVKFIVAPNEQEEGMWNWFVTAGGRNGFIWTRHRNRGTVITRRQGKGKVATIASKSQYDRSGKKPRIINFIVNDIVNY